MEELLGKVSDQIIQSCHVFILHVEHDESRNNLWKKSPEKLCEAIAECLKLRETFVDNYKCGSFLFSVVVLDAD